MQLSKSFELVIIILCFFFFFLVHLSELLVRTFLRYKISKLFEFALAVWECHYYRKYWQPKESQSLDCIHEKNDLFDFFAIKVMDQDTGATVGHFLMEQQNYLSSNKIISLTGVLGLYQPLFRPIIVLSLVQGVLEITC